MKVESKVVKHLWDGFVLETFLGSFNIWKNRKGWYTDNYTLSTKLPSKHYKTKEDIIEDINKVCNIRFEEMKHLIIVED